MNQFIRLRLGSHTILHGFDEAGQEISERVKVEGYADKLVAVERILSISERAILIAYAFDRVVYWDYEGSLSAIEDQLARAGLVLGPAEA